MMLGMVLLFRYNNKGMIHERIGKLVIIEMKSLCSTKGNVKRIRKQTTNLEKIFAKDISDKGLI